jgi:hypothetical protein
MMGLPGCRRLLTLGLIGLGLVACGEEFEPTVISQVDYPVGELIVTETIYEDGMGWPDHIYNRVYEVNGEYLAQYDNESGDGIAPDNPPRMENDWLVILSSSYIFFWQPDTDVIQFMPYDAEGWVDYANQEHWGVFGLNGHYDYYAADVEITGDRWLITYRCNPSRCPSDEWPDLPNRGPQMLQFYSEDQGETFHLVIPTTNSLEESSSHLHHRILSSVTTVGQLKT